LTPRRDPAAPGEPRLSDTISAGHVFGAPRLKRLELAESEPFALLRYTAATLVLAGGAVHLAQIGPHTDEDPLFGLFFLAVGVLQIAGGLYLLYPFGPERLRFGVAWFGIVGSLATIGIWAISRMAGLPFGTEPAAPETVGLADAAADLFELFTALVLGMWLHRRHIGEGALAGLSIAGVAGAGALAALWLVSRQMRWFDPDPRLVTYSESADLAAVGLLVWLAVLFARSLFVVRTHATASKTASAALLATLVLAALALFAFTLPARGGQNRDCAYGPIREDSGLTHAIPPVPIHLAAGEVRSVVALLLVACGPDPVAITSLDPIQPLGNAIALERITIDRSRSSRANRVRAGESDGPAAAGTPLDPSQGRYPVVVQVRGLQTGTQSLSAFRIGWAAGGVSGTLGFASSTDFCVGDATCPTLRR